MSAVCCILQAIKDIGASALDLRQKKDKDGSNFRQHIQEQAANGGHCEVQIADGVLQFAFWATPAEKEVAMQFGGVVLQVSLPSKRTPRP